MCVCVILGRHAVCLLLCSVLLFVTVDIVKQLNCPYREAVSAKCCVRFGGNAWTEETSVDVNGHSPPLCSRLM